MSDSPLQSQKMKEDELYNLGQKSMHN